MLMQNLIIGEIPYLDCYPYFIPLRKSFNQPFFQYFAGHPTELNSALKRGQIDVSISSSIEYCQGFDGYVILPDLCIGSNGPVGSVLLFSDIPIEDLDEMTISLPPSSASSVNLIKILLTKYYQFNSQFKTSWSEAEAHLLIGDSALREKTLERYPHVYDLGELWKEQTGLPMVFAVWIVRREAATEKREQLIALHQALKLAIEDAKKDWNKLASEMTNYDWMKKEEVVKYWRGINFSLTSHYTQGLLQFYDDALELNLVEDAPEEIEFMELPI
jgi:chorismate dehydratase